MAGWPSTGYAGDVTLDLIQNVQRAQEWNLPFIHGTPLVELSGAALVVNHGTDDPCWPPFFATSHYDQHHRCLQHDVCEMAMHGYVNFHMAPNEEIARPVLC